MKRTVLITGAARRIGRAMAIHLAGLGWNVAIHYNRSDHWAKVLSEELQDSFPKQDFAIFKAGLDTISESEALISAVLKKMGRLDLLINNASVFGEGSVKDSTAELIEHHMQINCLVPFLLIRDFAKQCKEGLIINMTDTRITNNRSSHAAYSLSKKALWELTKMAAYEFGPDIRVNAIAPGLTLPPEEKDEHYLWKLAEKIPMKRPGGIEPILKSLDFILNNDYLTGQLLFCDGGENLQ